MLKKVWTIIKRSPATTAALVLFSVAVYAATSNANLASILTQITTLNTNFGTTATSACSTDNGTCELTALLKRTNQNLTTLNSTASTSSTLSAATTGGCTQFNGTSAASTNATNVKNAAGTLCDLTLVNTTSTLYYFRLYNLSSSPTCSSATGFVGSIPVPHASGAGGGVVVNMSTFGHDFGTGIGFCLTGGGSSTDNTNAATGVYWYGGYK